MPALSTPGKAYTIYICWGLLLLWSCILKYGFYGVRNSILTLKKKFELFVAEISCNIELKNGLKNIVKPSLKILKGIFNFAIFDLKDDFLKNHKTYQFYMIISLHVASFFIIMFQLKTFLNC